MEAPYLASLLGTLSESTLKLPETRDAAWRNIPLHALYASRFLPPPKLPPTLSLPQALFPLRLVFLNGCFSKEYSTIPSTDLIILPLHEALRSYETLFSSIQENQESNPFSLLNAGLEQEGLFLYAPQGTFIDAPLEIIQITTDSEMPFWTAPRLHLFAGKGVHLKVVLKTYGAPASWSNPHYAFHLEENANVECLMLDDVPDNFWLTENLRATLKKGSCFKQTCLTSGGKCLHRDWRVFLLEERAETELTGLWLLKGAKQAHQNVLVEHASPNCRSSQLFKGVLDDTARSSFEGKIYVHPCAQQTSAYQSNQNLLLGDRAIAYSRPNLEIFADDVKASHGATIGQLDLEQLFYLKARGLSESLAKELLVLGFAVDALQRLSDKTTYALAQERVMQCLRS